MGKANAMTEETRPGLSDMMQSGAATLMPNILAAKAADLAWAGLSDEIEAEKAAILADGLVPPSDPQSQSLADLSAYMLAIYRILWQRTGDCLGAIDICCHVATTAFKSGVMGQRRFKIDLDQPEDAFETDRGEFPPRRPGSSARSSITRRKRSPTISTR